jgi:hypothetical protein
LPAAPQGRRNVTDLESRSVKTPRGFIQGYNAHAVATEDHIIIATEVTNRSADGGMLAPMIDAARRQLTDGGLQQPATALADAGYWSTGDIENLTGRGVTVLVPPDGHAHTGPPRPNRRGAVAAAMREQLTSDAGRALYRRRQTIIEPIFGHTKFNRRLERFRRRGLAACRAEWRLIAATHNLFKLWRATTAPATT